MRTLTLIELSTAQRKLGVLVIGSDKRNQFQTRELQSYRTVAEFLSITVLSQLLRQQRDQVMVGRAALLDAVNDGIVMVLPFKDGGHVLTVNQRFTRLFDVPEIEVEGHTLGGLLEHMQLPQGTRDDLRTAWLSEPVRSPTEKKGDFRIISSNGAPVDIEWYSRPVYQDGAVTGRIYVFHDCTADRTAARLRADFLSRVSHELRTPLTSIQGFAEFILEASGDQLPDLAREYTQIILNSAKHLKLIFNDMIDITRADAGQIQLNKEEASLSDIIIDVAARMELQYKERKQRLLLELDDDLPRVHVDVTRIIQVLTNLLTNAIKYSPEYSAIRITTELVERPDQLPEEAPRDVTLPAILVSCIDEGNGLSREETEKVFMPFYRTVEAKKNKIEGVGLGLAVTRSLIEVHRGKIWARPASEDSGGCFQFTLPVARKQTGTLPSLS
jgi:signal transduction histidine kinase